MRKQKHYLLLLLIVVLGALALVNASSLFASTWYVDNSASGANIGTSWTNAWTSLAAIVWGGAGVNPGDTVYISGGNTSRTYSERLAPTTGGMSGSPITIAVGQDAGHNGKVIISPSAAAYSAITLSNVNYINITGQIGSNSTPSMILTAVGNAYYGVYATGTTNNFNLSYVEVTNNPGDGIIIATTSSNLTGSIHHCLIHDNITTNLARGGPQNTEDVNLGGYLTAAVGSYTFSFHDNQIYNFHADAMKEGLNGILIYNNIFHDRASYKFDHPDGIQFWGSYVKIYNNTFYNFWNINSNNTNSYMRYNPDSAHSNGINATDVYIYNNLMYETNATSFASASVVTNGGNSYTCKVGHFSQENTEPGVGASWTNDWTLTGSGGTPWALYTEYNGPSQVQRGIELSFSDPSLTGSVHNIMVLNNTMVGVPFFGLAIATNTALTSTNVSNIVIENNIFKDDCYTASPIGGTSWLTTANGDGTITYGSAGSGADVIIDYNGVYADEQYTTSVNGSAYSSWKSSSGCQMHDITTNPNLDSSYQLQSKSPAIGAGTNLYSLFATDCAGNPRPVSGAWDIGDCQWLGRRPNAPNMK